MSVCLSIHPPAADRLPPDGFSWHFIFVFFVPICRWYASFVWKLIKITFYLKAFSAGLDWFPSLMLCSPWGTPLCRRKNFCNWERMCSLRRVIWDLANRTWLMSIKFQPDATICRYLFTAKSLYMFRVSQHPSSGVIKTVTATSGTGHNIGTATSLQRGLITYVRKTNKMHTFS